MDKEMLNDLMGVTEKTLHPEVEVKKNTAERMHNKSIMANVYRFGPPPDDPEHMMRKPHPKNAKKTVRFIKQNKRLYFNVGDWLKPYKNKLFEKLVKGTVKPPANKRLDQLWMWVETWQAIENAVKANVSSEIVVKTWTSGRLF